MPIPSISSEQTPKPTLLRRFLTAYRKASGGSLLLSIGIHAVILLIGAYLVVSQIAEERKISFGGGEGGSKSEVQHKVKRKMTTAPAPNKRITTTSSIAKVALPDMANIQMNMGPSISGAMSSGGMGAASGLGGGGGGGGGGGRGGGFSKITFFGLQSTVKGTGELTGTFYDLKQTKGGRATDMTVDKWKEFVQKWVKGPWDVKELQGYYAGPSKLHAPFIYIPIISANEGPKAFQVENKVKPRLWVAHYKARVVSPVSGNFRFAGYGDDILIVRFNGKVVLNQHDPTTLAKPAVKYNYADLGGRGPIAGEWFSVNAGSPYSMEVLIGECPGGLLHAYLLIEKANGQYSKDVKGVPILPIFRLANMSPPQMSQKDIKEQAKPWGKTPTADLIGKAPPYSTKDAPWSTVPDLPASPLDAFKAR